MKKSLLTTIAVASCGFGLSAFGQGTVVLENAANSSANVSVQGGAASAPAGSYQVALLWFNGSSYQQIGAVYQTTTANSDGAGYFFGETVTVPTYTATGTFEVQAWQGNFANYAAAVAGGGTEHVGQTPSFISAEGNDTIVPPGTPVNLTLKTPGAGNWNGNIVLVPVPEPTTIALGGLGAAALLLFRRRK